MEAYQLSEIRCGVTGEPTDVTLAVSAILGLEAREISGARTMGFIFLLPLMVVLVGTGGEGIF